MTSSAMGADAASTSSAVGRAWRAFSWISTPQVCGIGRIRAHRRPVRPTPASAPWLESGNACAVARDGIGREAEGPRMAISSDLERLLARWLPRQRWMPALGGRVGEEPDITPLSVARIADVTADAAGTVQCLLVVLTVRGPRRSTRLCVPLSVRTVEDYALRSHLVGVVDDLLLGRTFVYDGAADPVFVLALADAIRHAGPTTDPQVQTFLAGDELPDVGHPDRPEPVAAPDTEPDDGDTLLERAAVHRFRRTDGLGSESRIEIDGPTGTFALTILREIGAENPPAVRYPLALTAAESASVHPAVGWSQTRWFDDTDLTTIAAPFALLSHALP